jgi:hypothetical protein
VLDSCLLPNVERDKLALIVLVALDYFLILIMFLGLLRLRGHGGSIIGLAGLLWKQVTFCNCDFLNFLMFLTLRALFGSSLPMDPR